MTISVIGNVNIDIILRDVDELAEPGGERHIADASFRVGGSAGVTALALTHLGLTPRLYSAVGCDAFGALSSPNSASVLWPTTWPCGTGHVSASVRRARDVTAPS
jgi:hypothetical protein